MNTDEIFVEVFGTTYTVSKEMIKGYDNLRLAQLFSSSEKSEKRQKHYFNRSRFCFEAVLQYLETGELHMPRTVCPGEFKSEMEFWGVDWKTLAPCCKLKLTKYTEDMKSMKEFSKREKHHERYSYILTEGKDKKSKFEISRERIWKILDQRCNSVVGKVYFWILTMMVLASVFLIAFSSLPEVRKAVTIPDGNVSVFLSTTTTTTVAPTSRPTTTEKDVNLTSQCELSFGSSKSCRTWSPSFHRYITRICRDSYKPSVMEHVYGYNVNDSREVTAKDMCDVLCSDKTNYTSGTSSRALFRNLLNNASSQTERECLAFLSTTSSVWQSETVRICNPCKNLSQAEQLLFSVPVARLCEMRCTVKIDRFTNRSSNFIEYTSKLPDLEMLIYGNNMHLLYFEFIISGFFTCEYTMRLVCCPRKLKFLRKSLNILDLLALVAGYLRYIFYFFEVNFSFVEFDILLYFQIFRISRLFRPLFQVKSFRIFTYALRKGRYEIFLIFLYTFLGMVVFSNLIYFVENESNFESIPEAWWWSIITMSTVGYGDIVPRSAAGKIIGSVCALYGVIIYSLTIPMFVNTFNTFYKFASIDHSKLEKTKSKDEKINIPELGKPSMSAQTESDFHIRGILS